MGSSSSVNEKSVGGYATIYIPFFFRYMITRSIELAERYKGGPPNFPEVFVTAQKDFLWPAS
jgi:hypothetical protein